MIEITPSAAKEVARLLKKKEVNPETHGLRLGIQRGGCAGLQYTMEVGNAEENDHLISLEAAQVIVAHDSLKLLKGCVLDYTYSLSDTGFKIINPNATRSCGCGTSFESDAENEELEDLPESKSDDCSE